MDLDIEFDNYKLNSFYIVEHEVVEVVGYAECYIQQKVRLGKRVLDIECKGCKGSTTFHSTSGKIITSCSHSGSYPMKKMFKEVVKTNHRW